MDSTTAKTQRTQIDDTDIYVKVSPEPFEPSLELARVKRAGVTGALVSFIGLVRDFNSGDAEVLNTFETCSKKVGKKVEGLYLEHYPGMTERVLEKIAACATKRWPLQAVSIVHRVGLLTVADDIVLVVVASSHRSDAFDAVMYIMDYLKTQAPFWKKSLTSEGENWVKAQDSDVEAQKRWL